MIRWLRVVMPPWWAVSTALALYIGLDAIVLAVEWRLGEPFYTIVDVNVFVGAMSILAVVYAVFRVCAFHPACRPGYGLWLSRTPWVSRKPLPLGPVHLVLQDALLLGAAVGLCWPRAGIEALGVLKAFIVCYLAMLCVTHFRTGQKASAYAVAFGLGFIGLFGLNPLYYVVAGVTYGFAFLGLRASLSRFPWADEPQLQNLHRLITTGKYRPSESLGWPFARLGPGLAKEFQYKLGDAFLTGLLAGWAVFVWENLLNSDGMALLSLVVLVGVIGRICLYCHGYAPPLSLMGRLAHGRLIIPGYDQVFIAPLLAVLVYVAARELPLWTGMSELIAAPLGMTASWWVLHGLGPGLDVWRLTGNHRIVKGLMMIAAQQNR